MLGGVENRAGRPHRNHFIDRLHRRGVDVLEFEGHDVDLAREVPDRIEILVRGGDLHIGQMAGRGVLTGGECVDAIAHLPGGDGEHPAELPAAEDADGCSRQDRRAHESESSRTCLARSSRYR